MTSKKMNSQATGRRSEMKERSLARIVWPKLLMMLAYLICLDLVIGIVFRFPEDTSKKRPTDFQEFFEYGRSVEGKFSRLNEMTINWGWIGQSSRDFSPKEMKIPQGGEIAFYGMSHTGDLAAAFAKKNPSWTVHSISAPGAAPNWAYAAFIDSKYSGAESVAVLGIMTLGVPFVTTTSGSTMHFDASYPYTYPRFRLDGESLKELWPPIRAKEEFVKALKDAGEWRNYKNWLARNDNYYDPLLFNKSIMDDSSILRLVRRSYANNNRDKRIAKIYDGGKFNEDAEEVLLTKSIISEFARLARGKKIVPIVFVVNNQGCGDDMLRLIMPILNASNIKYLSSDKICPPNDPKVFLPGRDGHFTPEKDEQLADALSKVIGRSAKDASKAQGL
jgi:hypothetical protein